jgi:hypothetical protein
MGALVEEDGMSLIKCAISKSWFAVAGAALSIAAVGCSSQPAAGGTGQQPLAGTIGTGVNPATGIAGAGTAGVSSAAAGTGIGTGTAGIPAVATAGRGTGTAGTGPGTGEFGTAGTGAAGKAGTPGSTTGGAGAPATPTAGTTGTTPPVTGVCDKSTFLPECKQGGKAWGMPSQAGPCATGETIYGVKQAFGPYGVKSKYNVGQMFNTGNGPGDFTICSAFIDSFGADPVGSADLKMTHDLDFGLYSVFYPGCMPEGQKFPLITWGNGTCAMPEGYGPLLRYVASFGYIVVAANSVQTGGGTQMRKAIDFMFAENKDSKSEFFGKVDEDKVGAMGHSQGGMGTVAAAADARIKSVILWSGGTSASKPFLAVSGDRDIGGTPASMKNAVDAAPRAAAWLFYHQIPADVNGSTTGQLAPGHLTTMMEPERVQDVAVKWWDMMLKGDAEAKKMFVGKDCGICKGTELPSMWITGAEKTGPSHEFGANAMVQ